jgi:ribose-phosphate pyrophosphokinase
VNSGVRNAADALIAQRERRAGLYPHGVLSGGAVNRISKSRLRELVVSDTIAPTQEQKSAAEY